MTARKKSSTDASANIPQSILVRGARVHNLKNLDVDVPLHRIVGITGVSGSGKSSLALGVLYAEGSRRYLDALSTYTRRRMTQASRGAVDEVLYVPPALALRQRPGTPGVRSTFGTGTELLNTLRLIYSRLGAHRCPNGHEVTPSWKVAAERELCCPECGARFYAPSAEELAFNSQGACEACDGLGERYVVDEASLIPDESLTIDEGAVAPWNSLMWSLMKDVCREFGVRTDVPYALLSAREKEIVLHGPAEKRRILYQSKKGGDVPVELDFTYYNATYSVENALAKVKDEKGMKRLERFLRLEPCSECGGTRLSRRAREPKVLGISLDEACRKSLEESCAWTSRIPDELPPEMRELATTLCDAYADTARRLVELGLGYLTLDRRAATLSTGERQRMQLARAVRNRTTGALYILDEPSIGLHPSNIVGLKRVMRDLVADGNSVVLVDHDLQILREADWMIELGPDAGAGGGQIVAEGTLATIASSTSSKLAPFLTGKREARVRARASEGELFARGEIRLASVGLHTVKGFDVAFPKGRLIAVTGVSGSGKTTLVLETLVPALERWIAKEAPPEHVTAIDAQGITRVKLIDASPIGLNVRSTVATYANVHDEFRKVFARSSDARAAGLRAGDFSYNTGELRCSTCDGTGSINLDVQFLPDVNVTCPECRGSRYSRDAFRILRRKKTGEAKSLPEIMAMSVTQALEFCDDLTTVRNRLQILQELGIGYLALGEETTGLSGGEAQRLKLASEMGRGQEGAVFVFDEPTIGLHPLDVLSLLAVFDRLVANGATVVVVEHDLDLIRNADYVVDMGPGGGEAGGRVVAAGSVDAIRAARESVTGRFL